MTDSDPDTATQPAAPTPAPAVPVPPAEAAVAAPATESVPPAAESAAPQGGVLIAKAGKSPRVAKAAKVRQVKPAAAAKAASGGNADLTAALAAKIRSLGLSTAAAASQIGVGAVSLGAVLRGASTPNTRTIARYTAWVDGTAPAAAAPAVRARRPGRTPTPAAALSVKAAFAQVRAALSAAPAEPADDALGADALALAVHRAPAAARRIVAALLKAL